jgi:predicted nucleic acid-binding protein
MASAALVDSSVFITLLRRGEDVPAWLGERFEELYICGMVRLEVLRGVRSLKTRELLEGFMDVLCNIQTDNRLWQAAAALGWELDRAGTTLPAPDLVIAACALRAGVPVLTSDRHFAMIRGFPVIPFDPAG